MIPPSAYYISPLPEKVLQRGSTLTKDYSSSLEFCPSFSVHEHHGSTFSPCLRLVHHESHAKKCDMNTSRIIFVNEPGKTHKITRNCLVMTLPDWFALPLLLRIGNCITVYHVVMSAYLPYDSG